MVAEFLLYLDTFPVWLTFYGNHFDDPYLRNRSSRLGLDFWFDNLVHIDLLAVYKFVLMKRQDQYGLEFIAEEEHLGDENAERYETWTRLKKMVKADANVLMEWFANDRETLAKYASGDVWATRLLDRKMQMLDIVFAVAEASHVTVRDMLRLHEKNFKEFNTSVPIDGLILYLSSRREPRIVWPTRKRGEISDEEKFEGALVLPPVAGVHSNVVSLDVASLYPTILSAFNMGPETYRTDDSGDIKSPIGRGSFVSQPRSVIAEAIELVLGMRKKYKAVMKATNPASPEYSAAFAQDYAFKVLSNAIYGVVGASFSRYFVKDIAENVTLTGQKVTTFLRDTLESIGYQVISGDTDSVFFVMPDMSIQKAQTLAENLTERTRQYLKNLSGVYPEAFRLDVAELFSSLFIPPPRGEEGKVPKKRYAGIVIWQGVPTMYLMVRGFEMVRHDTSDAQKQAQREALLLLNTGATQEQLAAFSESWWARVDADDPEFNARLTMHRGIAREMSEYKTSRVVSAVEHSGSCGNTDDDITCGCPVVEKQYKVTLPMHIRVAMKLAEVGKISLHKGNKVALIKTGPNPEDVLPVLPGDRISLMEEQRRYVYDSQFGKMFGRLGIPAAKRTVKTMRRTKKVETCPTCGTPLESVIVGWLSKAARRMPDELVIDFYGKFSTFDGLTGIFSWIEEERSVPEGLFCPRGHVGISKEGRIVR